MYTFISDTVMVGNILDKIPAGMVKERMLD